MSPLLGKKTGQVAEDSKIHQKAIKIVVVRAVDVLHALSAVLEAVRADANLVLVVVTAKLNCAIAGKDEILAVKAVSNKVKEDKVVKDLLVVPNDEAII